MSDRAPATRREESIAALRRTFDRGRTRFIVIWGVVAAGVPLFVLMSLLPSLGVVSWLAESRERPAFNIISGAVLWPIAGYLFGLVLWRGLEWRYDALMRGR